MTGGVTFTAVGQVIGRPRPGQLRAIADEPRYGFASGGDRMTRVTLRCGDQVVEVYGRWSRMTGEMWERLLALDVDDVVRISGEIGSWNGGSHLTLYPTRVSR